MKITKSQLLRIIKEEVRVVQKNEGLMDTLKGYTGEQPGWETEHGLQHAKSPEGQKEQRRAKADKKARQDWEEDKINRYDNEAAWNNCRMFGKGCLDNDRRGGQGGHPANPWPENTEIKGWFGKAKKMGFKHSFWGHKLKEMIREEIAELKKKNR